MGVIQGLLDVDLPIDTLGIGVFDGFHVGHQALAKSCSHLLSFYPHPRTVLTGADIAMISTIEERRRLFKNTLWVDFTHEFSQLSPLAFLDEVILAECHPKRIVVGYDFRFGCQQSGTVDDLKKWGALTGVEVVIISPQLKGAVPIKSSLVREALVSGHLDEAHHLMGHPFLMIGQVVRGEGRGRTLGYPTANLAFPPEKLIPAKGVYTAQVVVDGATYSAMVYIGQKPTFSSHHPVQVEVYLLNFNQDVYGRSIEVWFKTRVRGEMTFASAGALKAQIEQDLRQIG